MEKNEAGWIAVQCGIPIDDCFQIIFTGNIGTAQGLEILPKAAALLAEENVRFVMVGDGRYLKEFTHVVESRGLEEKFVFVSRQPAEQIPALLAACDAAFLSFADHDLWKKTIPAKLQSYMACGMPIIASAEGETERIIREAECGVCSPIGDAHALAEKIKEMMHMDLQEMGAKGRTYFEEHFDKKKLMDQMDEEIEGE